MSVLTYIRLKAIVSFVRLFAPCPIPSPTPDESIQIPSRSPDRTIKAHVYRPLPLQSQTPSPVLLNFHGSGFVLHWHGSDDHFCRYITQSTGYVVLDIQYRLAPEHPFPCAPQDVEDAVKYVLSHPRDFDSSRISLSGFSAGGNLALGVSSSNTFPKDTFRSVLAFYPPTDLSVDPGTKVAPDPSGKPIPASLARLFDSSYIGDHDTKDPLISPVYANVSRFPKIMLIVTCGCDSLAGETERLADRIERDGEERRVARKRVEGVDHSWDKSTKVGSEGERKRDEVYAMAAEVLRM